MPEESVYYSTSKKLHQSLKQIKSFIPTSLLVHLKISSMSLNKNAALALDHCFHIWTMIIIPELRLEIGLSNVLHLDLLVSMHQINYTGLSTNKEQLASSRNAHLEFRLSWGKLYILSWKYLQYEVHSLRYLMLFMIIIIILHNNTMSILSSSMSNSPFLFNVLDIIITNDYVYRHHVSLESTQ